ncbi:hypothetical protein ACFQ4O_07505 [Methylopila musalis]|uniref:Uncharacterized protein n=1 Tax=Methylopila musalis TaxID=1134781 RepID=A0ABW3Z6S6_9HYPH
MIERDNDRFSERDGPKSAASMADFDTEDYRSYLEGLELDHTQEDALMRIVWDMVRMSVEMNVSAESWGQIVDAVIDGSAGKSPDVD